MSLVSDVVTGLIFDQISIGGYVFDAYLKMDHRERLTITKHPVQSGANISDHAYKEPREFEFLIGVSQTSQGKRLGQFGIFDRPSEARKKLIEMMDSRKPVTLIYKYGEADVLIDDVDTPDDNTTDSALRVTVHMTEVIITKAISYKTSLTESITDSNPLGQKSSTPVSDTSRLLGRFL